MQDRYKYSVTIDRHNGAMPNREWIVDIHLAGRLVASFDVKSEFDADEMAEGFRNALNIHTVEGCAI